MQIEISKTLASNGGAEGYDVMQLKKALNRLGFYIPYEKAGITNIPDQRMFDALKSFQRMNNLSATGQLRPGDETEAMINLQLEGEPHGYYIWRTVEDGKVRKAHAQYNRTIRSWNDSPDPGEDFNCRCWAEAIKEGQFLPSLGLNIQELNTINCDQKRDELVKAQKKIKDLSEAVNRLLLDLNELVNQNNELIQNAQKSLSMRLLVYLLTVPFEQLGILGDLLTRHFEGIISNELIEGAKNFMGKRKLIEYKIEYKKNQFALVFSQLEKEAENLEEMKKNYEKCK